MLQPGFDVGHFQHILLLLQFQRQLCGDGIGQTASLVDGGQRGQDFRRDFLVEFDELLKLTDQRAAHGLGFGVFLAFGRQRGDFADKIAGVFIDVIHTGALAAFHQHFHRAIRQLEQLQHGGHRAQRVQIVCGGLVLGGGFLRQQQDLLVGFHGLFQRLDGLGAPDEQGDDHMRKHHHVAQWQKRQAGVLGQQFGSRHGIDL